MNVWNLNPSDIYLLRGDAVVRDLMMQLRIPNLFARASELGTTHVFAAFDNHPTHWIIIHLWQGIPSGLPDHPTQGFAGRGSHNGLLFQAEPKSSISRAEMEAQLTADSSKLVGDAPFSFQQLPEPEAHHASRSQPG
ncbi:MAG TPA: hypothetical protein VMB21_19720 [Candidatus Limnocylindria bacterium]|jgi:hypothetical protein|nr:hypothetical protein [Candidatus Limnocylindria bacterium]HTL66664.1 hypothetical protein [Lacunisphaera sp.]